MRLKITVSKTAQGDRYYVQMVSDDSFSVNVVLIADAVEVDDRRTMLATP